MALTDRDLQRIEELLDRKLDEKFDEKLQPIKINQRFILERLQKVEHKLDSKFAEYDKKIEIIKDHLDLNG